MSDHYVLIHFTIQTLRLYWLRDDFVSLNPVANLLQVCNEFLEVYKIASIGLLSEKASDLQLI